MSKLGWRIDVTDDELDLISLGLSKAHQAQDILSEKLYQTLCRLDEEVKNLARGKMYCSTTDSLKPMRLTFDDEQETKVTGGQP